MTTIDKDSVREAYDSVRDDKNEATWLVLRYEGNQIVVASSGSDFNDFLLNFKDTERLYGYLRMCTGDEMSKRAKFTLVTWIGNDVSALKRAKISIDKALVKDVISSFAIEITTSELDELSEVAILEKLKKVGGANYGTGTGH